MPYRWLNVAEGAEIDNVIEHEAGLRSLRDAARMLAVGTAVVRLALERGVLPNAFQTPAGHWRVPLADIVAARSDAPGLFAAVERRRPDERRYEPEPGQPRRRTRGMPKTIAAERRARIIELLGERGAVRVSALSAALGVSQMTIRRDLDDLDREGLARRAHGGAVAHPMRE